MTANTLAPKLKKKYKQAPKTSKLSTSTEETKTTTHDSNPKGASNDKQQQQKKTSAPCLHIVTKEQLMEELERRLDEERDAQVEEETDEEEEALDDHYCWVPGPFPERVTIIGGGPAGMAAA